MKLSPDSPELTAYVLNELPDAERASVEAAMASSPELAAEVAQLRATSTMLTRHLASEPAVQLAPLQREDILRIGLVAPQPPPFRVTAPRGTLAGRGWQALREQWIWTTAAVATLMVTLTLWPQFHAAKSVESELRYQVLPERPAVNAPAKDAHPVPRKLTDTAREPLLRVPSPPLQQQSAPMVVSPAPSVRPSLPYALGRDPVLARRQGLVPRSEAPGNPALGQTLQEAAPLKSSASARPETPLAAVGGKQIVSLKTARSMANTPVYDSSVHRSLPQISAANNYGELRWTPSPGTESYAAVTDNAFKSPATAPLSTFSLDVDTASYANVRRFLREGSLPPPDAVRIEELINYFHYDYPVPRVDEPFSSAVEISDCPWHEGNRIIRIGLQAKSIDRRERPRANLVFLLDVSGSMQPENKLPLVQRSLRLLLDRLGERDTVSMVTYAGESRVALEPTPVDPAGRQRIGEVIEALRAGSGTAGSVGIQNAYALATNHFIPGGVNRVILCTDGDFNIGITDPSELQRLIEEKAKSGVFLSVLGYGMGNTKDSTMELLADKGNGNYAYVDSFSEARKVLGKQLEGTLVTVAKDVKVQVEFNPARVRSYRLIGYENRQLRDRDFNDDTKDAGEVGAGHQVTVLYEIEPAGPNLAGTDPLRYQPQSATEAPSLKLKSGHEDELLNLKIRYKAPDGDQSRLIEIPVKDSVVPLTRTGADFKFATAVAGYGMLLRNSPHQGDLTWDAVLRLAEQGVGADKEGYRSEFVDLARKARQLSGGK